MSLSAVQQHKSFKFSAPTFGIKYAQMNIMGAVKQAPPIEPRSYQTIIISNTPFYGDKGISPNPSKPWLEMYAVESDSVCSHIVNECWYIFLQKKRKVKGDDASCYHISQADIECDDKKKTFHVLLDGVLYGPFYRIRITPVNVNQDEIMTIPFMTFLPIELPCL
jgi:hypothetical protein